MTDMRKLATSSIKKMQFKNNRLYDRKMEEVSYKPGDLVYAYKETRANQLDKHYTGPFKIVEILDNNNDTIETNGKRKLKHVDKIKPSHIRP